MPHEFESEMEQDALTPRSRASGALTFEAEPFELDAAAGEVEAMEEEQLDETEFETRRRATSRIRPSSPARSSVTSAPPRQPVEARLGGIIRRGYAAAASLAGGRGVPELYEVYDEFEDEAFTESEIVPPSDSRTQVTQTKRIPYCWICTIIPTFTHPTTNKELEMKDQPGTGFLIGPRHVLTAAHVLFPADGPLIHQSPVRVKVTPGHNSGSRPYGVFTSSVYRVRSEWRSGGRNVGNISYDFAVIELPAGVEKKGLKYWGAPGTNTEKYPLKKTWLKGKVVNVCGYPKDKPLYTPWIAYDKLDNPDATRNGTVLNNVFTHKVDTCVGQSGSPVWYWDGQTKRYLVGIHTGYCDGLDGCKKESGTGCLSGSSRWSHNRGVMFSHEVQKQINAWIT
jgi:V8-like Glu-specific endopeptidase